MKYLTSTSDILSGTPVIKGTRTPIEVILYRLKEEHSLEGIQGMYPWVEKHTLERAIDEAIACISTTIHAEPANNGRVSQ
jgi:uncharacterized protein (DUF433 family)